MMAHDSLEPKSETSYEVQVNDVNALDQQLRDGFTINDQRDMQRMGKKQEFRRNFHMITTIAFTCCVMGKYLLNSRNLADEQALGKS